MLGVGASLLSYFFFFNDTATTEIYTLSLHDALPICARGAVRRAPDPARRGLRRGGSRPRPPTGRAADRRRDRGGRSAAPRGRLDGPPHLAGTGTRNVHHSERPGDHAPTGGDSRSGTAGDSQDAERRRADRCRASAARPSVRPIAAFRWGRGGRGRGRGGGGE